MTADRILIIGIGALGMLILMLLRRKEFPQIQPWKMVVLSIALTITGVLGTMLMFFVESGRFGGTSFFGAVLFVPILMLPTMLLKIPYRDILNLCAPAECLMLAVMKIDCLTSGCCSGRYIVAWDIFFPSQIVEMIAGILVMIALLAIAKKKPNASLYAWYLIIYGASRFVLNWFRGGLKPFLLGLPNGSFWSLISLIIGVLWLVFFTVPEKERKNIKHKRRK